MSLLSALRHLVFGLPETEQRELPTDVVADFYQRQIHGLIDPEHVTWQEFAQSYRSMSAMLMRFRAQNFAPFLAGAHVETTTDNETWTPVDLLHPYQQLVMNPNPHVDALEFWTFACLNRDGVGHADFMVDAVDATVNGRRARIPIGLYPIYPEYGYCTPLLNGDGSYKAWKYHRSDGSQPWLAPEEVIRLKRVHPVAFWRTAGLIEANAYELDAETAGNIYGRDTLRDAGLPPVVLETDNTITQANASKYRQIARDFARQYRRGGRDAVPVAHGGLGIRELSQMKGDETTEVRKFLRQTMWHVWETHEGLFAKDATRANAEAAFWSFSLLTAKPNVEAMARNLVAEFNRIFAATLGEPGLSYRLNVGDIVPVDADRQSQIDQRYLASGVYSINQVRERDGFDPIPNGDQHLVASNLMSLDSALMTGL